MIEAISVHFETIAREWIDYNGHMNVAYYVLVFDHATDSLLESIGLDAGYRKIHEKSVFVAESHIVYARELLEGAEVVVTSQVLNVDDKRLHLFQTMRDTASEQTSATLETLLVHVDLNSRRASPFPEPLKTTLAFLSKEHSTRTLPKHVGRQIRF